MKAATRAIYGDLIAAGMSGRSVWAGWVRLLVTAGVMKTLMRNGRDRRSETRGHITNSRLVWVLTKLLKIRGILRWALL